MSVLQTFVCYLQLLQNSGYKIVVNATENAIPV
jgi:hypothetical protein